MSILDDKIHPKGVYLAEVISRQLQLTRVICYSYKLRTKFGYVWMARFVRQPRPQVGDIIQVEIRHRMWNDMMHVDVYQWGTKYAIGITEGLM